MGGVSEVGWSGRCGGEVGWGGVGGVVGWDEVRWGGVG